ncbi:MAG: acyl-CoA thioesterase/bile acid-CoA:amino acid N-acyltransferase family protein [Haliea sp.]|uniref:acyl-CoA thioesterase/bile acid-CoA:amino acid N-acyltransferase family protein n=1 Tax=Marinobacter salarius TaxID=1420917 RepID=UPI0032EAD495
MKRFACVLFALFGVTASTTAAEIAISPKDRLWLDTLDVEVTGAAPGARVVVEASMEDLAGSIWTSRGTFTADIDGRIRTGDSASHEGTYTGVDPRGLIWSMLPTDSEGLNTCAEADCMPQDVPIFPALSVMKPTTISYRAIVETSVDSESTETVTTSGISRYAAVDVRRDVVQSGSLRGVYFSPPGEGPHPAVVVITGSGGGVSERTAALLASHGIAAFALGYFNYQDRPRGLTNIPLEYFRDGLDWLRRRAGVDRVGLTGVSRGGEGVLIISSTFPDRVGAVVSSVPSNVVQPGCCGPGDISEPAWTLAGEALTSAPYRLGPGESFATRFASEEDAPSWRRFYLPGMLAGGDAAIEVEHIDGPILFISGDADVLWPGDIAADLMMRRLAEKDFPHSTEHLKFTGAGHTAGGAFPVTSMTSRTMHHSLADAWIAFGGTPAMNAASTMGFSRQIEFFKTHLAPGG